MLEELTDAHIKHFLETYPLYTWMKFRKSQVNRSSLLINGIDAFCNSCGQSRPFHDLRPRGAGVGRAFEAVKTGETYFFFTCVSCRKQNIQYCVHQVVSDKEIKLQKFGQLPRQPLPRDNALQKFFSDDSELYEKAVISLANGYGIAAFAYFRRILENNIYKLLDLVQDDVSETGREKEVLAALAELRKESPMSERIKIANIALPPYLKPTGINPLGRLYQVLSDGVHSLSDEECLARAETTQECLRFLIGELSSRRKHREKFKGTVSRL